MIIKNPPCYDTSHWKIVPDFAKVKPRPLIVFTKATEALTYIDDTFAPYFTDLAQDGIFRGAYHFFRKAYDPIKQAQHFCNTIRPYVNNKDILVLDVEEGGETAAQLKAWFTEAMRQFPNNQFILYSRKNILDTIPMFLRGLVEWMTPPPVDRLNAIAMTTAEREFFRTIPVWTAGYPTNPDLYNAPHASYIPDQTKYGEVWVWQYTDNGIVEGISGGTDCNWLSPKLITWLGTQPPPQTGGTMYYGRNKTTLTNIRSGAGSTYADIGDLLLNDLIEASEKRDVGGSIWWRLTKITRNGLNVPLPSIESWVWGTNIEELQPPAIVKPDLNVTIEMDGYPVTKVNIKPL